MFPKIRWRVSVAFIVLDLVMIAILAIQVTRPTCNHNVACIQQGIFFTSVLLVLATIVVGHFVSERTARPLRQLTQVIRRIEAGDRTARMLPLTRDEVGELVRAFHQLSQSNNKRLDMLSKAYTQLATAVQYMADGVLITDESSTVQAINPAAMRILETTEMDALERPFAEVVRHHQLIEIWQRCRQSWEEQIEAVEIGNNLFLQTIVTPFPRQEARGFLVMMQDLTPLRKLQTVRRDFISNISHELRTPLASLRAVVETLQDGAIEDPPTAHRFLGRAAHEVDTLTQMVEELLELSRIESGQVPLKLQATTVSELTLIPIERLREQAQRNEVEIILDLPAGLPLVLADAGRIQQVITNLIHNALKFTDPGGRIVIRAYTKERRFPGELIIAV
ncbi:MAG: HAMP domain-containing protein, partial [Anaerolineales bacterium]|nr:HAMP domain-containing protein [Anaerolineales bacterium]